MKPETITALKGHLLGAKALRDAMDRSLATAASGVPNYFVRYTGFKQYMTKYNDLFQLVASLVRITTPIGSWNLDKVSGPFETPGFVQQE